MTERIPSYIKHPAGSEVEMLVDDTHAVMTKAAFDQLNDYSTSLPSGVYIRKRWKRNNASVPGLGPYSRDYENPDWYLGEYTEDKDPAVAGIKWRRILLLCLPLLLAITTACGGASVNVAADAPASPCDVLACPGPMTVFGPAQGAPPGFSCACDAGAIRLLYAPLPLTQAGIENWPQRLAEVCAP